MGRSNPLSKNPETSCILTARKQSDIFQNDAKDTLSATHHDSSTENILEVELHVNREDIFNRHELLRRLGNMENLIADFINMFIEEVDRDLPLLEEAIKLEDIGTAANLVHAIKGVAGNIGANQMYSITTELDKFAKAGDILSLKERIAFLRNEYELFKIETATESDVRTNITM